MLLLYPLLWSINYFIGKKMSINYLADYVAENEQDVVAISKDAKAIVPANITPIWKPGRSLQNISHPDHTWEQGRTDAVISMTFLFIETRSVPHPITRGGMLLCVQLYQTPPPLWVWSLVQRLGQYLLKSLMSL